MITIFTAEFISSSFNFHEEPNFLRMCFLYTFVFCYHSGKLSSRVPENVNSCKDRSRSMLDSKDLENTLISKASGAQLAIVFLVERLRIIKVHDTKANLPLVRSRNIDKNINESIVCMEH